MMQIGCGGIAVIESSAVDQHQRVGIGGRRKTAYADIYLRTVAEQVINLDAGNAANQFTGCYRAAVFDVFDGHDVHRGAGFVFHLFGSGRGDDNRAEFGVSLHWGNSQAQACHQGMIELHVVLHAERHTQLAILEQRDKL